MSLITGTKTFTITVTVNNVDPVAGFNSLGAAASAANTASAALVSAVNANNDPTVTVNVAVTGWTIAA